jgi:hypothetical protein
MFTSFLRRWPGPLEVLSTLWRRGQSERTRARRGGGHPRPSVEDLEERTVLSASLLNPTAGIDLPAGLFAVLPNQGGHIVVSGPTVTPGPNQTSLEGRPAVFNLGSFTEADNAPWAVSVDWGDGTTTSFTTPRQGQLGRRIHTYAEESAHAQNGSTYTVRVTVTDHAGGTGQGSFSVTVSDQPLIPFPIPFLARANRSFTGSVAGAIDPGGVESSTDYSATIDWRDGTTTTGNIAIKNGVVVVNGTHTYAKSALFLPFVMIAHETTPAKTIQTIAIVLPSFGGGGSTAVIGATIEGPSVPFGVSFGDPLPGHPTPVVVSQNDTARPARDDTPVIAHHHENHLALLELSDKFGVWSECRA